VVKGRNRDTAWYSIVDSEWPAITAAFGRWLDPANFDPDGRQRERLSTLIGRGSASRQLPERSPAADVRRDTRRPS
jgi:hypothetical protein